MNEVRIIAAVSAEILDRETLVKKYLKVDHTDEDALIDVLISSAREQIERWCGIALGVQERQWIVDVNNKSASYNPYPTAAEAKRNQDWTSEGDELEIPYGPVDSSEINVYQQSDNSYSGKTLNTDYHLESTAEFITFKPGSSGRWKLEYTTGYTDENLPSGLKLIWLQLIAYLYMNRQDENAEMPGFIKYALQPYKRSLI